MTCLGRVPFSPVFILKSRTCRGNFVLQRCHPYAGSGLPQGLLQKTSSTPPPLNWAKRWGFRENPEMGLKWARSGFRRTIHPLSHPKTHSWTHFSPLTKTHLKPTNLIRKSLISVIFPPAFLGPEMAAPILWAPGIFWLFCWKTRHAHKIPRFRGGGGVGSRVFWKGRWKCQFYFYGRGDFSESKWKSIVLQRALRHPWPSIILGLGDV